jgi:hypothetical protein
VKVRLPKLGLSDELMTKHGHYFDLVKAQTRTKEDNADAESNAPFFNIPQLS